MVNTFFESSIFFFEPESRSGRTDYQVMEHSPLFSV